MRENQRQGPRTATSHVIEVNVEIADACPKLGKAVEI